jgi:hypothetical protein
LNLSKRALIRMEARAFVIILSRSGFAANGPLILNVACNAINVSCDAVACDEQRALKCVCVNSRAAPTDIQTRRVHAELRIRQKGGNCDFRAHGCFVNIFRPPTHTHQLGQL